VLSAVLATVFSAPTGPAPKKSYEGYKIVVAYPNVQFSNLAASLRSHLRAFEKDRHVTQLHQAGPTGPLTLLVSPEKADELQTMLKGFNVASKVQSNNYQKLIDLEKEKLFAKHEFKMGHSLSAFPIDKYHNYQEILDYLESLEKQFPKLVKRFTYGKSTENRDLIGVKIGSDPENQKGIWIDGGTHAREWITGSSVVYIIDQLVNNKDTKPLTDGLNWYLVPIVNPDGYEYSLNTDREWRKTRSQQKDNCYGVDPNRNFDFHWDGEGSSDEPCEETFRGPQAFSEPEVKSITDFWGKNAKNIQALFSLHSFSELWMLPYAYKKPAVYPPDYEELLKLAQEGEKALEATHGEHYTVGNIADMLYAASGSSIDYAKGVNNIKYSYAFETRPKGRRGVYGDGFHPDETEIIPTGEELFAGIKVVAQKVISE